jgi:hypothetical protein
MGENHLLYFGIQLLHSLQYFFDITTGINNCCASSVFATDDGAILLIGRDGNDSALNGHGIGLFVLGLAFRSMGRRYKISHVITIMIRVGIEEYRLIELVFTAAHDQRHHRVTRHIHGRAHHIKQTIDADD